MLARESALLRSMANASGMRATRILSSILRVSRHRSQLFHWRSVGEQSEKKKMFCDKERDTQRIMYFRNKIPCVCVCVCVCVRVRARALVREREREREDYKNNGSIYDERNFDAYYKSFTTKEHRRDNQLWKGKDGEGLQTFAP